MSYITVPEHINVKEVININNHIFVIEESSPCCLLPTVDPIYMILSLKYLSFYSKTKKSNVSFEEFIKSIMKDFPNESRYAKKNTYLCFFYHSQYTKPTLANNFTTFTTICYDDYKEILLLLKEIVINDLYPVIWKLLFSLLVTDKSSIKNNTIASYSTMYIKKETRDIIHASLPVYMFND